MGTVTYAKFNYNDKLVVSSSQDGTVKLWDSTIGIIIRVNTIITKIILLIN